MTKPPREESLTNGVESVETTECYPGANTRGTWDTDSLLPSPTSPLGRVDFRRQSSGTSVGNSWCMGLYTRFKPKDWSARINLKLSYISTSTNQHVTSILAAHFCTIMERNAESAVGDLSSQIWTSGCSSGTAPNHHNPGSSYKVQGLGLFEASGQPHMCSDGEKKSQKVREHPQSREINTRAHTGLILGLGCPAQVTLPASNIPGMERRGDWTILREHLKCRKNDQHVAIVQARHYRGHTFLLELKISGLPLESIW